MDEYQNLYCRACKISVRRFGWIAGNIDNHRKRSEKAVSREFLEAIDFSGLEIEPWEVHILAYSGGLISLVLMLALDAVLFSVATYDNPKFPLN
jgi:hypothetical protein